MNYNQRKQINKSAEILTDFVNSGAAVDPLDEIKRDLEGWREVLLRLASLLRWDKPFYPAITAGAVSFLFLCIWYLDLSTVTTVSLLCMIVTLFDFIVPFLGPTITGLKNWTGSEEIEFSNICEHIQNLRRQFSDTWHGLSHMRQENPKAFFFVTIGFLLVTAWIGNLVDNLLLTYLLVTFALLIPGLRHNNIATKYFQPVYNILLKLRQGAQAKKKDN